MKIMTSTMFKDWKVPTTRGFKVIAASLALGATAAVGVGIYALVNGVRNANEIAAINAIRQNTANQIANNYVLKASLDKMVSDLGFIKEGVQLPATASLTTQRTTFQENELVPASYLSGAIANSNLDAYTKTADLYTRAESDARFALPAELPSLAGIETKAQVTTRLDGFTPTAMLYTRAEAVNRFATLASVTDLMTEVANAETKAQVTLRLAAYTPTTGLYTRTEAVNRFATAPSVAGLTTEVANAETKTAVTARFVAYTPTTGLYIRTDADALFATAQSVVGLTATVDSLETAADVDRKLLEYTKTSGIGMGFLPSTGGQLSGLVLLNSNTLIPTSDGELTTKQYVDDQFSARAATLGAQSISTTTPRIEGGLYKVEDPTAGQGTNPIISSVGFQPNSFYDHASTNPNERKKYIIRKGDNPATPNIEEDYYLERAVFSLTGGTADLFFNPNIAMSTLIEGRAYSPGSPTDAVAVRALGRVSAYDSVADKTTLTFGTAKQISDIDFIVGQRYVFWTNWVGTAAIGIVDTAKAVDAGIVIAVLATYNEDGSFINALAEFTDSNGAMVSASTILWRRDPEVEASGIFFSLSDSDDPVNRDFRYPTQNSGTFVGAIRITADPAQLTA